MDNFVSAVQAWIAKPFDPEGDVWNWGLFVLLILIACLVWWNVLSYLKPAARAVTEQARAAAETASQAV